MKRKFRRIITGHNTNGKSIIVSDEHLDQSEDIWMTFSSPADNTQQKNTFPEITTLAPPNGTRLFFFKLLPDDPSISTEELDKIWVERCLTFEADRPDTTRDPRMHRTRTIDYIILLEGEVTLIMDEGEVNLKPFEVVIQRGTNHAWINKSSKPVLAVAIVIDAKPL